MSAGEKYVAAAYLVVFAAVLVYVVIIGLKLQRLQRELAELAALARARRLPEVEQVESREAAEVG
jgi:CcmD family protein